MLLHNRSFKVPYRSRVFHSSLWLLCQVITVFVVVAVIIAVYIFYAFIKAVRESSIGVKILKCWKYSPEIPEVSEMGSVVKNTFFQVLYICVYMHTGICVCMHTGAVATRRGC